MTSLNKQKKYLKYKKNLIDNFLHLPNRPSLLLNDLKIYCKASIQNQRNK